MLYTNVRVSLHTYGPDLYSRTSKYVFIYFILYTLQVQYTSKSVVQFLKTNLRAFLYLLGVKKNQKRLLKFTWAEKCKIRAILVTHGSGGSSPAGNEVINSLRASEWIFRVLKWIVEYLIINKCSELKKNMKQYCSYKKISSLKINKSSKRETA